MIQNSLIFFLFVLLLSYCLQKVLLKMQVDELKKNSNPVERVQD